MRLSTSPAALRRTLAFSLLLLFAAHAFCFFNLTFSGASVMLNASSGRAAQIAAGQYLQPLYWRVRGALAAPLLVGMLSALYLAASAALTAALLRLEHPLSLFMLCGLLTVNAAVTSICAASLSTADAAFLSLLLSLSGAALCLCTRWGFAPGALCFAASLAMECTGLSCGVALLLIALARSLICGTSARALASRLVKALLALLLGLALFGAGYRLMLRRNGLEAEAALMLPEHVLSAWLEPFRLSFAPLTAYPHLNVALRVLLLALGLAALALCLRRLPPLRGLALVLVVIALPLAVNLPVFSAAPAGQTRLSFCLLDLFVVVLLDAAAGFLPRLHLMRRAAAGALAVLFLGSIVFSNQVYLKKNLERDSTLSVMTRVLARIEQAEGYVPGETPVALIGTLEDSALSVPHEGFEHLAALEAAAGNYAAASAEENIWYMWEVLGYPLNFVSAYEQALLEESDEVQRMPAFPAAGCCQFIGGTLVVKLS